MDLKIAQVCPRYYPFIGGVETYVREISERLAKRGFDVEVICTDPSRRLPGIETVNRVRVRRFPALAPGDAYYFSPQLYLHLIKHKYDLIHAHSYHAFPALFAALAKNGSRFVFTPYYHGGGHTRLRNMLHIPYRFLGNMIFRRADRVTCLSRYEREKVMSDFRVRSGKIEKIPVGMNPDEFAGITPLKRQGGKKILYTGRIEEYKGIQHIIKALPHLDGFELEIIGTGPYEGLLRRLAERLNVAGKITWHGAMTRDRLLQHYASADVFVMLSTHESYGITVAESLASGTPCIVACGSALEEFVDGVNCLGITVPVNAEKVVDAIKKIESSSHGQKYAGPVKFMDWDTVTERLIEVYRSSG
ncbi:MAG TPA: glycosyltransferase family 4 protein [Candidatus Methanoperedenaceae archaeon]|nr:glycosyltransferase family 4 protein [Candidatus Methanoperedenaceae archaeon]